MKLENIVYFLHHWVNRLEITKFYADKNLYNPSDEKQCQFWVGWVQMQVC